MNGESQPEQRELEAEEEATQKIEELERQFSPPLGQLLAEITKAVKAAYRES